MDGFDMKKKQFIIVLIVCSGCLAIWLIRNNALELLNESTIRQYPLKEGYESCIVIEDHDDECIYYARNVNMMGMILYKKQVVDSGEITMPILRGGNIAYTKYVGNDQSICLNGDIVMVLQRIYYYNISNVAGLIFSGITNSGEYIVYCDEKLIRCENIKKSGIAVANNGEFAWCEEVNGEWYIHGHDGKQGPYNNIGIISAGEKCIYYSFIDGSGQWYVNGFGITYGPYNNMENCDVWINENNKMVFYEVINESNARLLYCNGRVISSGYDLYLQPVVSYSNYYFAFVAQRAGYYCIIKNGDEVYSTNNNISYVIAVNDKGDVYWREKRKMVSDSLVINGATIASYASIAEISLLDDDEVVFIASDFKGYPNIEDDSWFDLIYMPTYICIGSQYCKKYDQVLKIYVDRLGNKIDAWVLQSGMLKKVHLRIP